MNTQNTQNLNKCYIMECNKKLLLTSIKCKCNNTFCDKHRYPESHNCSFNYKLNIMKKLRDNNPQILDKKIESF